MARRRNRGSTRRSFRFPDPEGLLGISPPHGRGAAGRTPSKGRQGVLTRVLGAQAQQRTAIQSFLITRGSPVPGPLHGVGQGGRACHGGPAASGGGPIGTHPNP